MSELFPMFAQIADSAVCRFGRLAVRWTLWLLLGALVGGEARSEADVVAAEKPEHTVTLSREQLREVQVQAAILVKLGMFVEWPHSATETRPDDPVRIGILGDDPFRDFFDESTRPESINGRPVLLHRGSKLDQLTGCEIIFISTSEKYHLSELLEQLQGKPFLTVSAIPDFARRGGMIGFIKEDGKVGVEINQSATDKAHLRVRAKLLQLGKIVPPADSGKGDG